MVDEYANSGNILLPEVTPHTPSQNSVKSPSKQDEFVTAPQAHSMSPAKELEKLICRLSKVTVKPS
jgi:hypothetical protein